MVEVSVLPDGTTCYRADDGCLLYMEGNPSNAVFVMYVSEGYTDLIRECSMDEWKELVKDIPIEGIDIKNFMPSKKEGKTRKSINDGWWRKDRNR